MGDAPLISVATKPIPFIESYKTMRDYRIPSGSWNWSILNGLVPPPTENEFAAVMIRQDNQTGDGICWGHSIDGLFKVKSDCSLVNHNNKPHNTDVWKQIWRLHVPQKIRNFMRLLLHGKIMTNQESVRRG